jgi:hypothetical protein
VRSSFSGHTAMLAFSALTTALEDPAQSRDQSSSRANQCTAFCALRSPLRQISNRRHKHRELCWGQRAALETAFKIRPMLTALHVDTTGLRITEQPLTALTVAIATDGAIFTPVAI